MTHSFYISTGNQDKLRELTFFCAEYLPQLSQPTARATDVEETGDSYQDNAMIKAHALVLDLLAEGHSDFWVLADDSGVSVDLLGGAPGIHSARYAGVQGDSEANIDKLLNELSKVSSSMQDRTGAYHCALCLLRVESGAVVQEWVAEGALPGLVGTERLGSEGYAYDRIFLDPISGRCYGEIPAEEKNRRSHRQRAFAQLAKVLSVPKS